MGTALDDPESARLIDRLRAGDPAAIEDLFARHRDRLRRMVDMRLDRRLQGRIDASDVIQEAHLEAAGRLADYLKDPKLPPFLWLRLVVGEPLAKLHRAHLGAQMRDAARQESLVRD